MEPCYARVYVVGNRVKVVSFRPHHGGASSGLAAPDAAAAAASEAKRADAISRAKRRIFEAIACNPWDWFVTLTLDPEKTARRGYGRGDLAAWRADLAQWLRNRRRLYGGSYAYVLVPETHADGRAWHMHGVLAGLPAGDVGDFPKGAPIDLVYSSYRCWLPFSDTFGYCSLAPIRDKDRAAAYMTKYVTKDAGRGVTASGGHMYFCSRGLQSATQIAEGVFGLPDGWAWDYEGDHASVRWLPWSAASDVLALMVKGRSLPFGRIG